MRLTHRLFISLIAALFAYAFQQGTAHAQTAYSTVVNVNSGKCADVEAGGWNTGDRIIQYACHNLDNQQWTLTPYNGSYQLVGKRLGQCMTVSGDSSQPGAVMVQYPCGGYLNQLWDLRANGNGWQLLAKQTGMCLAVQNASLQDVMPLIQQACQGGASELWTFTNSAVLPAPAPSPGGTITTIVPSHSGKCLMISGGSNAVGAQAVQAACNGSAAQKWKVTASGTNYTIVSTTSGLCLGIVNASTALEAQAVQLTCNGATNMLWTLRAAGNYFNLIPKHSGLCLDIYGSSWEDGANAIQWTCEGNPNQQWALTAPAPGTPPASPSAWSPVIQLPIVPVAAAMLPTGKVLTWSAFSPDNFGDENRYGYTYSALFDPATQSSAMRVVSETGHDMFCPGTSFLADGRLLVNGGSSSQKTSIYNPFTDSWAAGPLMNIARGYQGNATLANGAVLTLGGSWSGGQGGKIGEIWTAGGGWKKLTGISANPFTGADPGGVFRGDNHLWLFPYTNGRVFHAGPTAAMHWITTGGSGQVKSAGNRGDDAYSMNGNAVMIDIGKILKTGGAPAYEDAYATASSYLIDLNTGATRKITPMNYARTLHNSTVLPNGQVVITGGQTYAKLFSDERSVLMSELFDPKTETFIQLSAMQVPRNYHSISLLLPDGRVLVGGGGLCGS
ncbi:MAG: RICIN domain-containing protein, partial [Burkholderiales bacterium]|nr:RICIN domain-containing protein [Burkholderiales bacterium]